MPELLQHIISILHPLELHLAPERGGAWASAWLCPFRLVVSPFRLSCEQKGSAATERQAGGGTEPVGSGVAALPATVQRVLFCSQPVFL
jgi:hypothetical protein